MIKKYELFENIHKGIDPYGEEDWEDKKLPYEYETKLNIGAVINPAVHIDVYKIDMQHMMLMLIHTPLIMWMKMKLK